MSESTLIEKPKMFWRDWSFSQTFDNVIELFEALTSNPDKDENFSRIF